MREIVTASAKNLDNTTFSESDTCSAAFLDSIMWVATNAVFHSEHVDAN